MQIVYGSKDVAKNLALMRRIEANAGPLPALGRRGCGDNAEGKREGNSPAFLQYVTSERPCLGGL